MQGNAKKKNLVNEIVSKKTLDSNSLAINSYDSYRRTSEIIERTKYALGRKPIFKINIRSTINDTVLHNAKSSAAQKV